MDFIRGNSRDQLMFSTLEMQIEQDNPVQLEDTFILEVLLLRRN
ncbi:hypothetical protein BH11BAC1_BH11BAC1_09390 [soil metagenome]